MPVLCATCGQEMPLESLPRTRIPTEPLYPTTYSGDRTRRIDYEREPEPVKETVTVVKPPRRTFEPQSEPVKPGSRIPGLPEPGEDDS